MSVPNGWVLSPADNDPTNYYQATIGNYITKDGQSVTVVARTDVAGNYSLYKVGAFGGLGTPFYTFNQSGTASGNTGNLENGDFLSITRSVKQRSYEINQAVGTEREKETLSKSNGYKSLSQSEPPNPDRPSGESTDNTDNQSGSGDETGTTPTPAAKTDTRITTSSESFNSSNDKKYNNSFLIYPQDISSGQDRIVIVQKSYKSRIGQSADFKDLKINYNYLSEEKNMSVTDTLGIAVLPMPNDISETNVTDWGENSLSTLAAIAGVAGARLAGRASEFDLKGGFDVLKEFGSEITTQGAYDALLQLLTLNAGAAIVQKFGVNIDPEAFRSRLTGTAINNNLELLFKGVKLRSFGFQFKMTPRSETEARNIRYIIKFFKRGMAAKRNADQPFFLGAPNVFDIHFRSGKNNNTNFNNDLKSIGKIKTCALQQCVVNYTPDGFYAAFQDSKVNSQPIAVTMQLAFTELYPIYNDNYDDTDSVGWDKTDFSYTEKQ